MKKQIILLFFFVSSINILAQNNNAKSIYYLGVSYGNSFPLGDFKSNDASSAYYDPGFAETGSKLDLFWGCNLSKNVNLTALIRAQKFGTDSESIANNAQKNYPTTQFFVDSKDWECISFLMGGNYKISISKKMSFHPKAMIGLIYAKSPEINVIAINGNLESSRYTESSSTAGFAYEFGLGLERKLGTHFALMPSFDLSGGFLTFNDLKTRYGNGSLLFRDYLINLNSFNLGLALSYIW